MNTVISKIRRRMTMKKNHGQVFIAKDFAKIGSRAAIDQALTRLCKAGVIQRVDRGMYSVLRYNALMQSSVPPSLDQVVAAVARRDSIVVTSDSALDANITGLTTVVPAQPVFLTNTRARKMLVAGRKIQFKKMPAWMAYWVDRPASPVVKALHWLGQDIDVKTRDFQVFGRNLPAAVADDLSNGMGHLPSWIQSKTKLLLDNYAK